VFYTYPSMVAVISARVMGEHLGPQRLTAILTASVGMILVVVAPQTEDASFGIDGLGVLFAFGAALCQTGYALVASRGFASVPTFQASTLMRGFSVLIYAVVLVPLVLLIGDVDRLLGPLDSPEAWVVIIVAGVLGAALPTAALVAGYRRVGATRGAVLMLLEPVVGVLLAALWLAERPSPLQLVGGLMVLAGAALAQLSPTTGSRAATPPVSE
jgi:drug/metabolite transporter (DMT)-like permease